VRIVLKHGDLPGLLIDEYEKALLNSRRPDLAVCPGAHKDHIGKTVLSEGVVILL
jgi:hypothetical protein